MKESERKLLQRVILVALLSALAVGALAVLHPFIVPVAWAAILAYTTWPAFGLLKKALGGRVNLAAFLMTIFLAAAFVAPLLLLIMMLQGELKTAYAFVTSALRDGPLELPEPIRNLPVVGAWLAGWVAELGANPAEFAATLTDWARERGDEVVSILGGVGRNTAKFGFALITVFFLYRSGEKLLVQTRNVLYRAIGPRVDHYLDAVGATTRAVVFGLVLTAFAQGSLAGVGYAVAGVSAPALLGALTALIALLPFGAPLVWLPISLWMIFQGDLAAGLGLLAWGALVVSWVDNLIRPIVISNATDIPFLLVMFGVLGGLAAFGLVGVFLGPVVLAVMLALWREWLGESVGETQSEA